MMNAGKRHTGPERLHLRHVPRWPGRPHGTSPPLAGSNLRATERGVPRVVSFLP